MGYEALAVVVAGSVGLAIGIAYWLGYRKGTNEEARRFHGDDWTRNVDMIRDRQPIGEPVYIEVLRESETASHMLVMDRGRLDRHLAGARK